MKQQVLLLAFAVFTANLQAQLTPTVVADGFSNSLIGVNFDAEGNIWVAEYGTGNNDGVVTRIDPAGNKVPFITGLPSEIHPMTGELAGPTRTHHLANNKVMVIMGEGTHAQSEALLIFDKTDYAAGTPLTLANVEQTIKIGDFSHAQGFTNSNPYNIEWDVDSNLLIVDAGANSILKRDKNTGALSILKTLDAIPNPLPFGPPFIDPVPTDLVRKPDGTFFVSQLTGFPFVSGLSSLFNLDGAGNLSVQQGGFTLVTDLAFDPKDGNLCLLQFSEFGPVDSSFSFYLGSAKVIKLLPDGSHDTIASNFGGLNSSMNFDANGDLYVTDLVFGQVLKFDFPSAAGERPAMVADVRAFPNPFSEKTTIEYELAQPAQVKAEIFDLFGRRVAALEEGQKSAGTHAFSWDGAGAAPGMYVYRLQVGEQLASGVLSLVR